MSQIDSTLRNMTNDSLQFSITDNHNIVKAEFSLNPKDSGDFKVFIEEYNIKICKINDIPTNKLFRIKFSSFIACVFDSSINDYYFHDFVKNIKYKPNQDFHKINNPNEKQFFPVDKINDYNQNYNPPRTNIVQNLTLDPRSNFTNPPYQNNIPHNIPANTNIHNQPIDYNNISKLNLQLDYSKREPFNTNPINQNQKINKDKIPENSDLISSGPPNRNKTNTNMPYDHQFNSNAPNYNIESFYFDTFVSNLGNNDNKYTSNNYITPNDYSNNQYTHDYTKNYNNYDNYGNNQVQDNYNPFTNKDNFNNYTEENNYYKPEVQMPTEPTYNLSHIDEEILSDKFNIFNQLHRKLVDAETLKSFVNENEILFRNDSEHEIYVKISEGGKKPNFEMVLPQQEATFYRNVKSIYKMRVVNNPLNQGPVFNVKSGCVYIFDENNNLVDLGGNTIKSSSIAFEASFEMNNCFDIFYDLKDIKFLDFIKNTNLIIVNKGSDSISIRLDNGLKKNDEDYIEIEPMVYVIFQRNKGKFPAVFNKIGSNSSDKYSLATDHVYIYDNSNPGLYDFHTRGNAEKYVEPPKINKESEKKPKAVSDSEIIWEILDDIIINHKCKIKSFDSLLFNFIEIKNNLNEAIHIRMKMKKIGSEEFINLDKNESFKWKRLEGDYLTEIITEDCKSKRYKLEGDHSYIFNNKTLTDISFPKDEILTTNEMFGGDKLVYFNKITSEYLTKQIDFGNTTYLPPIIPSVKKEEENIEYFNGLKPNYIPGTPFVDTEFPPDKSTLAAIDSKTGIKRTPHFLHAKKGLSEEEMETMDFKRPKDIFDKQYYLYKDEINYDDVKQGSLGNCYLISVLAALSQRPQLIKNVFKSKVVNPDGFYELYFYEKNKKKVMYIDDNLVAYKSKFVKEFMFANPNGEELWVMLIEKAYAKFEGGYSNIIGGLMHPEIQFLTGAMAREIQTKDKNCWTEIYNACMGKNILTT